MKKIIILAFCSFAAQIALALTKTIDGIKWNYYTANGSAVLEYPNMRGTSSPKCTHEGSLPRTLMLPEWFGNVAVTNLGAVALQINNGVDVIVVPQSYKTLSKIAIVGSSLGYDLSGSYYTSYTYRYSWNTVSDSGCTNILFLGDCPNVISNDWFWSYDYRNIYLISPENQFDGCNCYIVEGAKGWSFNDSYCGGCVKYGAAPVTCLVDGVECITGRVFSALGSSIELSCPNALATIHYTIDGSEPTSDSPIYTAPISSGSYTLKAIAVVPTYPYTVTRKCMFKFADNFTPEIMASQENFIHSGNAITLMSNVVGSEIRYTLDGSEPTVRSILYEKPFIINETTTVKAKAFRSDWLGSETATATFTREWYTVTTPVIVPSGVTFENASQEVSISCETEGVTIRYTTDGSDPMTSGLEYKRPFAVYKSCTVRAVAVKDDWKNSAEATSVLTRGEGLSEAANIYGVKMETGDGAPWTVDAEMSHDGVSSVRSGGDGSYLQMSVRGAGMLSFWWRAMCEEPGYEYYDYGCIKMGSDVIGRIAGEDTGWEYFSTKVASTAKHVFRWEYHKDDEGSFQPDCVWVDQVQWIPADGSGYTLTTPEPVPYAWLDAYRLGVGTDYETAGNAASGKMQGSRALQVWQDYVAGTDPTNLTSRFTAKIEMVNGAPVVMWEPDLNTNGVIRTYKVYGKETLEGGEWQYPTNSLHRFFKVTVEMP